MGRAETHWNSASWNASLQKAIGELDQSKAQTLWNQVQQVQYEQGGYILWTNADWVDALVRLAASQKAREEAGRSGREFADAEYADEQLLAKWDAVLDSL